MSFVRTFIDDDLAFAVAVLDLAGPLVQRGPPEPFEQRLVEVAFDTISPMKADWQYPWVVGRLNWQPQFTAQLQLS